MLSRTLISIAVTPSGVGLPSLSGKASLCTTSAGGLWVSHRFDLIEALTNSMPSGSTSRVTAVVVTFLWGTSMPKRFPRRMSSRLWSWGDQHAMRQRRLRHQTFLRVHPPCSLGCDFTKQQRKILFLVSHAPQSLRADGGCGLHGWTGRCRFVSELVLC